MLLSGQAGQPEGKLCSAATTLSYGSRDEYIRGLEPELVAKPVLSLAGEFEREVEWTDWKGGRHTLRAEWEYVNGPAAPLDGCTAGTRDGGNAGKLPADFQADVNGMIRQRRSEAAGEPSLPEEHAYLSIDEVLAVRLYSGPAYQPINGFLRQLAHLLRACGSP